MAMQNVWSLPDRWLCLDRTASEGMAQRMAMTIIFSLPLFLFIPSTSKSSKFPVDENIPYSGSPAENGYRNRNASAQRYNCFHQLLSDKDEEHLYGKRNKTGHFAYPTCFWKSAVWKPLEPQMARLLDALLSFFSTVSILDSFLNS